jgi:hypothetical protein
MKLKINCNLNQFFRENTMDQQLALIDLSQRLSALQSWAIGEVSWLESLAYFAIAVCTAYLTTAWSRAIEARGWIFALLFLGVLFEQGIFKIILSHHEGASAMFHKVVFTDFSREQNK